MSGTYQDVKTAQESFPWPVHPFLVLDVCERLMQVKGTRRNSKNVSRSDGTPRPKCRDSLRPPPLHLTETEEVGCAEHTEKGKSRFCYFVRTTRPTSPEPVRGVWKVQVSSRTGGRTILSSLEPDLDCSRERSMFETKDSGGPL